MQSYRQRRKDQPEVSEITSELYIGNVIAAEDPAIFPQFKTIIRVNDYDASPELKAEYSSLGIRFLFLKLSDYGDESLKPHFQNIIQHIDVGPKPLLIHCEAGRSRSVSFLVAYLMVYKKYKLWKAYELVKSKRNQIDINISFMGELMEFDSELAHS